jgi:hypothetical protein
VLGCDPRFGTGDGEATTVAASAVRFAEKGDRA